MCFCPLSTFFSTSPLSRVSLVYHFLKMGGHDSHNKSSISDEDINKLLARAETQTFSEAPKYAADEYSGAMPVNLAGRFENERARLGPEFTEADRQWRIKWIQDQALHHSEPYSVPAMEASNLNPIRRFYRWPLNFLENALTSVMARPKAVVARKIVGRSIMGYFIVLTIWYNLNYNSANWEVARGPRIHHTKESVLPGDSRYPMPNPRTESWQHYDRGFHDRNVFLN